jgi:serine/threonine-protein kinase HipA
MQRKINVHVELNSVTHSVGTLWSHHKGGRQRTSFAYYSNWLQSSNAFALEPSLYLSDGVQHTQAGKAVFGSIGDCAPDRWGRVLIQRNERRHAELEGRQVRTLSEVDYLIGVGDYSRQGALRFALSEYGEYLSSQDARTIPPLVKLGSLLQAADRITRDDECDEDLQLLLAPGSSLGGARAKASVLDVQGELSIAKFPQFNDEWSVCQWEATALELAKKAGITTPYWRIENVGEKSVLLVKRFDRDGIIRIPFLSAMSMISAVDNEFRSYLEIADAIRRYGSRPEKDLQELWRRIAFSISISNTDDHLRNHGFLYDGIGWRLSPVYDINPIPLDIKPRILSLAIDEFDANGSLDLLQSTREHFGLSQKHSDVILKEVKEAVHAWRDVATHFGISSKEQKRMASAFL